MMIVSGGWNEYFDIFEWGIGGIIGGDCCGAKSLLLLFEWIIWGDYLEKCCRGEKSFALFKMDYWGI